MARREAGIDIATIALWLGHEHIASVMPCRNSRELHQPGEKPQVAWPAQDGSRCRHAIAAAS
jgi:hypothetical protein